MLKLTGPVEAPAGTCAITVVALQDTIVADVPLNDTVPDAPKLVPVIVTWVPTAPDVGEIPVMVGAWAVKFAITLSGPFIVKYCGVLVPLRFPLKPAKT